MFTKLTMLTTKSTDEFRNVWVPLLRLKQVCICHESLTCG